ncbi:MAG: Rv1355c family protein [Acidimicrobiales bacterium]
MTTAAVRYRYGASFVDRTSGLRFEGHHPAARPDRWRQYLDGAVHEYERYGVAHLIDRRALERAEGVSLFFVGVDPSDRVVAGVRCHGPLDPDAVAQALVEMASSPEIDQLRAAVERVKPYGVIELKGAWLRLSRSRQADDPFNRVPVHALEWLGAEVALLAVTARLEAPMELIGARRMGREVARYPTERHRTILMGLHRARYRSQARPDFPPHIRRESEQLRRPAAPGEVAGWRPVVLDQRCRADRQVLANLRGDPGIETVDMVERQRAELAGLLPVPAPALLSEPERLVYYPWRRAVVRMLGPAAFRAVRLDRNRNRITAEEQERLSHQRVGVVGLSAGHSIATTVALEGLCGELRLADFDQVELTNLNRLPGAVLDVGLNKAVVAARRVAEIDPYLPVRVVPEGLTAANAGELVAGLDVLVEECDSIDMKVLVREVARRHRVPVVMETSDRGLLDVERFDVEPERPIFHGLLPGVTAAGMASMSMLEKVPHLVRLVEPERGSARLGASLAEIGRTLSTWPQLGSDVTLGGASVAAVVRRLGLGLPVPSGRVRVDIESLIGSIESPGLPPATEPPPLPAPAPVPADPTMAIAHAASLAPSGGNAQPWRFGVSTGAISFELDRERTTTMDVRSRGSYVALGAAVFNARVAAAAAGRLGSVQLFPDGEGSDVVATLAVADGSDGDLAGLYPWVLARCANRRMGSPQPLDLDLVARMAEGTAAEGAGLHVVTDRDRIEECADVLAASERIRFLTPILHREMIGELRWPRDEATTGIDVRTLELSALDLALLGMARRPDVMALLDRWDEGSALGNSTGTAVRWSSALAVVTVADASPLSYVRGGAAVERLWIAAQQAGLGVQPVSPVFLFAVQQPDFDHLVGSRRSAELAALADRFRSAVGVVPGETLALALRLSHVPPPSARSARLPLDRVVHRPPGPATGGSPRPGPGDAAG